MRSNMILIKPTKDWPTRQWGHFYSWTPKILMSTTNNKPLDNVGFVNQNVLLDEKLKHNFQASPTQNKLVFWCQCLPCTSLSFATGRTGRRSQKEGVWAGEAIEFCWLYGVFHGVSIFSPSTHPSHSSPFWTIQST